MFIYNIEEYINLDIKERQKHLELNSDCIERGGQSMYLKGLLAHICETTIPSGHKIHVCHACHNAKCSNPKHIYWGTAQENRLDAKANGAKSVWERMIEKYGLEEAKNKQRRSFKIASQSGKGNIGKPKSEEHKKNISKSLKNRPTGPTG